MSLGKKEILNRDTHVNVDGKMSAHIMRIEHKSGTRTN